MKKITLIMITALFLNSCITFKTVPNFVSSKELAALTIGTSKAQVKINLGNTSPYDILAGWSQDCEVHQYKYKKSSHKLRKKEETLESGLSSGKLQYDKPEDAYLVYKNGKLSTLITDAGKKDLESLMDDVVGVKNACSEKGLAGCMDPESINYNKDAVISDGNCEYCPCDFVKNPNYDKNKPAASCQTNNLKCIPVKKPGDNGVKKSGDNGVKKPGDNSVNEADKKKECTDCDIIEKIASNPNANITINLGSNSNSLRNVFSPSKKKTTISLTETESDEDNKVISEIPDKRSKKQKGNEEKANKEKPNLFKPN
jgi:hypothetical protein